jgi:hypothetical protein
LNRLFLGDARSVQDALPACCSFLERGLLGLVASAASGDEVADRVSVAGDGDWRVGLEDAGGEFVAEFADADLRVSAGVGARLILGSWCGRRRY